MKGEKEMSRVLSAGGMLNALINDDWYLYRVAQGLCGGICSGRDIFKRKVVSIVPGDMCMTSANWVDGDDPNEGVFNDTDPDRINRPFIELRMANIFGEEMGIDEGTFNVTPKHVHEVFGDTLEPIDEVEQTLEDALELMPEVVRKTTKFERGYLTIKWADGTSAMIKGSALHRQGR